MGSEHQKQKFQLGKVNIKIDSCKKRNDFIGDKIRDGSYQIVYSDDKAAEDTHFKGKAIVNRDMHFTAVREHIDGIKFARGMSPEAIIKNNETFGSQNAEKGIHHLTRQELQQKAVKIREQLTSARLSQAKTFKEPTDSNILKQ